MHFFRLRPRPTGGGGGATPAPVRTPAVTLAPAPATLVPSAAVGKELFISLGCLGCHRINGEGGVVGSPLTGVFGSQRELEGGGTVTADHEYMEESILDPDAKVVKGFPQGVMLPFDRLSHSQIDQLIKFMEGLK